MTENPQPGRFTALVLAADRGAGDPVAQAAGVSRKCLAPVAGRPMLARVIDALQASPWVEGIAVSIDDPDLLADQEIFGSLIEAGQLRLFRAEASPSRSVLAAAETLGDAQPLLVTTADHALLSPAMVDHFCAESLKTGADVTVGLTAAVLIRAGYPESRRTYLQFRDDGYSGSNLFAFMTAQGREAARFWRRAEQERKRPWRIARLFGPRLLLAYLFRRLSLDAAMVRISSRLGFKAAAIKMPSAEAAIDVDRPADLDLVERILGGAGRG